MVALTKSIAVAMTHLRTPQMESFIDYLNAERQEALEQMMGLGDEPNWRRLQGKAQFISRLLDEVEKSVEIATKLSRHPGNGA